MESRLIRGHLHLQSDPCAAEKGRRRERERERDREKEKERERN